MLAEERQARIVRLVQGQGTVTTTSLMEEFDASESTIRRDLATLDRQGLVARVHGGATRADTSFVARDESLPTRRLANAPAKMAIARYASALVGDDDFVFVDGGSTTGVLAGMLAQTGATFVTDSLPVAQTLLSRECQVLLLGGTLKPLTEVVVGGHTLEAVAELHFTLGFFGTNGATPQTGFTTPEPEEAHVKRLAIQHTERPYVLCDASKFRRVSPVAFCAYDGATIVTDSMPEEASYRQFQNFVEVEA